MDTCDSSAFSRRFYYSSGQEEELARFYGDVLGLQAVGRSGLTFRVGEGLLLLFDAGLSSAQSQPPPHGARGPVYTCFVARADEYERWKYRVSDEIGSILQEIEWDNGLVVLLPRPRRERVGDRRRRSLAGGPDAWVIVYAVVDDALSPDFPLGVELDVFVRREDAELFIEEVRGDELELAATLRTEERELEAGGRTASPTTART